MFFFSNVIENVFAFLRLINVKIELNWKSGVNHLLKLNFAERIQWYNLHLNGSFIAKVLLSNVVWVTRAVTYFKRILCAYKTTDTYFNNLANCGESFKLIRFMGDIAASENYKLTKSFRNCSEPSASVHSMNRLSVFSNRSTPIFVIAWQIIIDKLERLHFPSFN